MTKKTESKNFSRRGFAAAVVSGLAAPALMAQQSTQAPATPAPPPSPNTSTQRRGTVEEVAPFPEELTFTRQDLPLKVQPFPMTQVRLLPSIFLDAQDWDRGYMQRLGGDRLVYNFRQNAGLPTSAKPLGGWEQPANGQRASELRGHFTGHFLSASAQMYASTGDKEVKAKADEMVDELSKCQAKLGGGYLSAFPTEFFDRLDARRNVWAPFYTIHKIMAGLFDMHRLTGNKQALAVVEGMAGWVDNWTGSKTEEHMQSILNTEYGGMNEVLYNLAAATGNDQWAKVGDRYTKRIFFNPLAMRRDELRGLHVNTHIPQVIGAARRYEISRDMRFHDVADFFWYEVTTARAYVTGGTSNGEGWLMQPRMLGAELKRSVATAECCCAYNMLKLTRHLYTWTADPRYFDYYERTLFNHRIGTIRPEKGYTQYYLSLTPGAWKTFNTEDNSFWCCTGTGVEEYSKLNDSIYWQSPEGLYVNLFVPSELDWAEKGLRLRQETKFPAEAGTKLTVSVQRPVQLAVSLRVPSWLASAPRVKVNGKAVEGSASPGGYLTLSRLWKNGDHIEMELPMHLHTEAMPDEPQTQAILYGPIVLAGDLGSEGLTERLIIGPSAPRLRPPNAPARREQRPGGFPGVPEIEIPTFRASGSDTSSWVKPADQPLAFRTTGQQKDVTLVPLNSLFDKRYSVYWQVS
ncbi:MAG TPA: beta-L-arabinofuranosidase domain-containing protein [Bryobacteraceae bacterium]|nr:beta-L-arabinofuranosidase domain-containing protein [Bryobacteraceae bacterium]